MGSLEFHVWSVNLSYINGVTVVMLKMWMCTRSFKCKHGNRAVFLRMLSRRHSQSAWCLSLTSLCDCTQFPPPAVPPASTSQKHTAAEGKQLLPWTPVLILLGTANLSSVQIYLSACKQGDSKLFSFGSRILEGCVTS